MGKNERIALIKALIAASIEFHETLKEHGYSVDYGLDGTKRGSIRKIGMPAHQNWPIGNVSIDWSVKECHED